MTARAGISLQGWLEPAFTAVFLALAPTAIRANTLRVEYAGCQLVRDGPVCIVPADRRLVLWVEADAGAPVHVSGAQVLRETDVLGGRQLTIELEQDATRLVAGTDANATWTLALSPSDRPQWLEEADRLLDDGQIEAARERVDGPSRDQASPWYGAALGVLGRAALKSAEWREAERLLRGAMLANGAVGDVSEAVRYGAVLVWLLIERGRFAEAASVLDDLPQGPGLPAKSAVFHDFYGGMLAKETSDLRGALALTAQALERAERLDLRAEQTQVRQVLAEALQSVGRGTEAQEAHAVLLKEAQSASGCDRALLLDNAAWVRLLECEAGPCTPPVEALQDVEKLHATVCRDWPAEHVNALVNLALAHYHAGQPEAAHAALERVHAVDPDPALRYVVWMLDIEGRLAMRAENLDDARRRYEELGEAAESLATPEAKWRARLGAARVLAALGDPEALRAYGEAEELLEAESHLVPLHEGRDTFVARRERATREYLALLLDRGESNQALTVARRARARVLRGVRLDANLAMLSPDIESYMTERESIEEKLALTWTMSEKSRRAVEERRVKLQHDLLQLLDRVSLVVAPAQQGETELPTTRPGEVSLVYHPLPDGWVGFAADAGGVSNVRRLGSLDALRGNPAALAQAMLAPFAAQIDAAKEVRFLPYGALRQVDFQALPLAGHPLVMAKPSAFALDLPPASVSAESARKLALLVGDPTGDLPWAAREIENIARSLDDTWRVETLIGPAAKSAVLRELIPQATLFHYAGHAVFRGRGGWDSELPLADNTSLGIEDILALERVPQWVVLSSCRAAESASESAGEGIGVAQAFLLAGASGVVAPTRDVADRDATALISALYREWRASGDLVVALQRAQQELLSMAPRADWASFRVIVR